jgi:SAM-dependent methyltransferase
VFDTVVDEYVHGRPDMPLEAVLDATRELELPSGGRVLEIGAGTGALTVSLVAAGFDVVALEPGPALRAHTAKRVPEAQLVGLTFEDYEPEERFAGVFSSNAFHWVDPAIGYAKAASIADALVLVWDVPFLGDPELHRRVQDDVMGPRGSTFPNDEAGVRELFDAELAEQRAGLAASGAFEEPWLGTYEQRLEYTAQRYADLLQSMSAVAAQPDELRAEIGDGLRAVLGDAPFELVDLVYVLGAKAR